MFIWQCQLKWWFVYILYFVVLFIMHGDEIAVGIEFLIYKCCVGGMTTMYVSGQDLLWNYFNFLTGCSWETSTQIFILLSFELLLFINVMDQKIHMHFGMWFRSIQIMYVLEHASEKELMTWIQGYWFARRQG